MDKIIRCITSDGAIMAACVDASDIVFTAKKIHHLSRSATAALGRLFVCNLNYGRYAQAERCVSQPSCNG